jgi:hypothetical protein
MPGGNKVIFRRALSETSATASDLGTPGEVREDTAGNKYRLVYMAAAATHGQVLRYDYASGTDGYSVIPNDQSKEVAAVAGVQNQAGTNLATGIYCWAQYKGYGSVSVAASYDTGLALAVASAGLASAATANVNRWAGHTIASVTTGVQKVRFDFGE